jgi:hypothetical protein
MIRISYFATALLAILSACECEPDVYGERLELVLPITTFPQQDTFQVGDTMHVVIDFEKDVVVDGIPNTIYLQDFLFPSYLAISEISDTVEDYNVDFSILPVTGVLEELVLVTGKAFAIRYEEDSEGYHFACKVILSTPGIYFLGLSATNRVYKTYEHPAVYTCGRNRRDDISITYMNESTTETAFNNIFLSSPIDYFHTLYDYKRYSKLGAISFVVIN